MISLPRFFDASRFCLVPAIFAHLLCPLPGHAEDPRVSFQSEVLPLLADRCFLCHGPDEKAREGGFRLDVRERAIAEADSGEQPIVPGNPAASEMLRRLQTDDEDEQMPPPTSNKPALTADEIEMLRRWISEGAPWERHWSFVPPRRPKLPNLKQRGWTRNEIDFFVQRRLEQEGLRPAQEASKTELMRRVTLSLTGLPPDPKEIDEFLADTSPAAYERLVDRLLASPRYGERMAWPWMDAARYADTAGYQGDPIRVQWPWRDWVVDALNENMPFDQFTIQQLAGDLLPGATPEQRLATAFHRNHMHNSEGGRIAEETRVENVFDRTETTGTVWLGLTFQCARCHDHKFDPLTIRDYFALYDLFNQSREKGNVNQRDNTPIEPSMAYTPRATRQQLADFDQRISELETQLPAPAPELSNLRTERDALKKRLSPLRVMVMDTQNTPRETYVLVKGVYNDRTDQQVTSDVPAFLPPLPQKPDGARYNRLDLARWIVAPENPLTARVTVNRYWQTFFGRGIVATPEDFGVQGARPTHPALLDWLAANFVESGWDVKRMHKLIVTSATYRQSSRVTPALVERDPKNVLLARGPRFRLPSWMLRDQALAASGLLVPKSGGPPVKPYQPPNIWAEATFGKKRYKQDSGESLYRRSLYIFWRRIVGPTMFFDVANRQTCAVKTTRTNTPLHALATLNDVTYVEAARVLAEMALKTHAEDRDRLNLIYRRLTARPPESAEQALLLARLGRLKEHYQHDKAAAAQLLSVGERKRDESLDVAEHAAYTAICNILLNLDEVLNLP